MGRVIQNSLRQLVIAVESISVNHKTDALNIPISRKKRPTSGRFLPIQFDR